MAPLRPSFPSSLALFALVLLAIASASHAANDTTVRVGAAAGVSCDPSLATSAVIYINGSVICADLVPEPSYSTDIQCDENGEPSGIVCVGQGCSNTSTSCVTLSPSGITWGQTACFSDSSVGVTYTATCRNGSETAAPQAVITPQEESSPDNIPNQPESLIEPTESPSSEPIVDIVPTATVPQEVPVDSPTDVASPSNPTAPLEEVPTPSSASAIAAGGAMFAVFFALVL